MLELIIAAIAAIGNAVLAVLVLAKNPRRQMNVSFAGFALSLALWAGINYLSLHPVLLDQLAWIRIVMALSVVLCVCVLLLANSFPDNNPSFKNLYKIVLPPAGVVFLLALTPWLFTSVSYESGRAQPQPGLGMIAFAPFVVATIMAGVIILFRKFRRLRGVAREYVRYALAGVVATVMLLVGTNFVAVIVFNNSSLVAVSPILSLIFTASFAYGMVRYKLFDIRLIVARFIAYIMFLLFASALYAFIAITVSFFVAGVQPNVSQVILSTVVVGVLILFAQPLKLLFNRITKAIFYQDNYDTKNVLDQISSVMVRSTDTDTLTRSSMRILMDALRSEYISIFLLDSANKGEHRYINEGIGVPDLSKFTPAVLGKGVSDFVMTDVNDSKSEAVRRNAHGKNIAVITRLETQGGTIGYCFFGYKTSGSPYNTRDAALIRIARDELAVAIQNALRFDQIQAFNKTLKLRIEEATKELRESNAQLQRLDEAKDEFVSMASHQLRTPLTSVKGYISMVLEGDAGKITSMQHKLLGEAFTSSERMVHLIGDFLNVSRLQTGTFLLEIKPVSLAKIVTQEVESLQTTAHAHNLKLHYRSPSYFPILNIDDGKIRQVLMNFIDNAIYYSEEDTTIDISLKTEGGYAVLEVKDTGIGVPKDEQKHIFTKFFRATNARKQRPDGTGVGLFLAKKVIAAHGGTMVFESEENKGSTFGFRLPIKKLSAVSDTDKLGK
jgi:signal transduction histidine kinase